MLQMRRRDTAERLWALRLRFSNGQIDSAADRYFSAWRAFSNEVDIGPREENASKQKTRASVLIPSEPIRL
jgi:hypothetical protein